MWLFMFYFPRVQLHRDGWQRDSCTINQYYFYRGQDTKLIHSIRVIYYHYYYYRFVQIANFINNLSASYTSPVLYHYHKYNYITFRRSLFDEFNIRNISTTDRPFRHIMLYATFKAFSSWHNSIIIHIMLHINVCARKNYSQGAWTIFFSLEVPWLNISRNNIKYAYSNLSL